MGISDSHSGMGNIVGHSNYTTALNDDNTSAITDELEKVTFNINWFIPVLLGL